MIRIELMRRMAAVYVDNSDIDAKNTKFNTLMHNAGWVKQSTNSEEVKRDAQEIINRTKNMIDDIDGLENSVNDVKDHAKLIKDDLVQLVVSIED